MRVPDIFSVFSSFFFSPLVVNKSSNWLRGRIACGDQTFERLNEKNVRLRILKRLKYERRNFYRTSGGNSGESRPSPALNKDKMTPEDLFTEFIDTEISDFTHHRNKLFISYKFPSFFFFFHSVYTI